MLFEQLAIQLQDFPAPPPVYRAQDGEPPLVGSAQVRLVTGYSGAGKTAWAAQAALHTTSPVAYFDVSDTPGPALASALARELAARLFGQSGGLGEILLPGSSGIEILLRISARLAAEGMDLTLVLDNCHRLEPADIVAIVEKTPQIKYVLLIHPGRPVAELEARLQIASEPLKGWDSDTVAATAAAAGGRADVAATQRLLALTAGLPLYILNAIAIVVRDYGGALNAFCDHLEAQTHEVETAQELILGHVFDALPEASRSVLAVLSLSDLPLARAEADRLLHDTLEIDAAASARALRQLRTAGCLEVFGGNRVKIHDALRLLGAAHLHDQGDALLLKARTALKDLLSDAIRSGREMAKLGLYLRTLGQLGDIKTLVEFATDELYHELGTWPEITPLLEAAAQSPDTDPSDRFSALDGLAFGDVKRGEYTLARSHIDAMGKLLDTPGFGSHERLVYGMKRMNVAAVEGNAAGVIEMIAAIVDDVPDNPRHQRIFRYNAAHALYHLGHFARVVEETEAIVKEYYAVLGLSPGDLIGRNADKIRPLLTRTDDLVDDLKHQADTLDLYAKAMTRLGRSPGRARLDAMKFYDLAQAPDSLVRVGQDLVDEFIERHDYIAAREMMETNLVPTVLRLKLAHKIVPVRSQYAVVLAYCGAHAAADAEMAKLAPFEAALEPLVKRDLVHQRALIRRLRLIPPPPQWTPPLAPPPRGGALPKVGRNAPCPCGSGQKYKKCHGRL